MKLSTHELFPLFNNGKVDKNNAMIQCVGAFERQTPQTLTDIFVLVTQEDCVYAPIYWRNNHRMGANALTNDIDLIVYDSDDGDTEEEIAVMLAGVEYLLLRTASWSKELQKYRIFIPLEKPMSFIDPEEYKLFYRWLGNLIGLRYDLATTEPARGYIGLKGAQGTLSKGIHLNVETEWKAYNIKAIKLANRAALKNKINRSKITSRYSGSITPQHLKNKPKFIEYNNNIYQGNYHNGIMAIIGYFKKSGCQKGDVRDWLIDQRFGTADEAYINHRMRNY